MNIRYVCCTLAQESGDAIIVCDADGAIRFWNRGAERIFGFAEADALGRSLDMIIPETLRARHAERPDPRLRTHRHSSH